VHVAERSIIAKGVEMPLQTVAGMVAEARSRIEELTADKLAGEMQRESPLVVDIREADELRQTGVIPGAVFAARGMLEFYADPTSPYFRPEFERDRRIVLYCASGGRSALAAAALHDLGYTRIAHLAGGVKAWSAAGHHLSSNL
jgi:rhodanese-related sulfurtransferase